MLSVEIVRSMIDYHHRCTRHLWESIMTLTDDQFTADDAYSHGSIRNLMVHLAATDRGWMRGLHQDPNARTDRPDPADYPTRESVRALCDAVAADLTAYVASLDEDDLRVQVPGLPMPVWQTLLHLVNHGTDHRAQILRALHDLGAPTFGQDLVFHLSD